MTQKTFRAGGVTLGSVPIMLGAGACKTPTTTKSWLAVTPVVSGSYTPDARSGNEGNVLTYPDNFAALEKLQFGLNALGMPNLGYANAANAFASIETAHPLIVSIAGFSRDDFLEGIEVFSGLSAVSAIECNFGCPNVRHEHDKIASFDPHFIRDFLVHLQTFEKPIWIKLSPYSDPGLLREIARVLNEAPHKIAAVVSCNTYPSAYLTNTIDANFGYAGLSGPALHPIALGQVRQLRTHLDESIDVIGVGGVDSGQKVLNMLEAGAIAVQLTSLPFWLANPNAFGETLFADGQLDRYLNQGLP